jgi:uncharacterized protein (DUF58 family)
VSGVAHLKREEGFELMGVITLFLVAVALASVSIWARLDGHWYAFVFLGLLALLLGVTIAVTVVPRLLRRLRSEVWESLLFFRITLRGAFFLILLLLIGAATVNTGNNLLVLILSLLIASILVSGMVSNLVLSGLKVSLNLPESIFAGQRAILFLTLSNLKARLPSFALRLRSVSLSARHQDGARTDFYDRVGQFPYVQAGDSLMIRVECSFRRRGLYPLSGFEVRTDFPFGFFTRGRRLGAEGGITVYPAQRQLKELFQAYPFLQGADRRQRKGTGIGLYNIRDYHPGDDARRVHWKATGKLSRLMVKEFIREEDSPFEVAFSTRLPGQDNSLLDSFETAVAYIASLVRYYWQEEVSFSFRSEGFQSSLVHPEDLQRVMEFLAAVEPAEVGLSPANCSERAVLFWPGELPGEGRLRVVNYLTL